jgi:hypothetical protein
MRDHDRRTDDVPKVTRLHEAGARSDEEYAAAKAKLLA